MLNFLVNGPRWLFRSGLGLALVACFSMLLSTPVQAASSAVTAIQIDGPYPDATVLIDGDARGVIASGLTVELPPGVHEVVVTKKGYKNFKATVNLAQGSVQKVDVATMQKSSKTWIWILIGVGAAVIVGGAIAVAASSGGGYGYY